MIITFDIMILLLRIIAIICLIIIITLDDFPFYKKLKNKELQLIIASLILIILIFVDNILGLILGILFFVIYYEIYYKISSETEKIEDFIEKKKDNNELNILSNSNLKDKEVILPDNNDKLDYISEALLKSAQNNIIDEENYNKEIMGIDEKIYNQKVLGIQGLDTQKNNYIGLDKDDKYFIYE